MVNSASASVNGVSSVLARSANCCDGRPRFLYELHWSFPQLKLAIVTSPFSVRGEGFLSVMVVEAAFMNVLIASKR